VASPTLNPNISRNTAYALQNPHEKWSVRGQENSIPTVTALSMEFVAKPEEAQRLRSTIPAAVSGALRGVTGFAGCMVMASDHEARLVTVMTLWRGTESARHCGNNVKWVNALLKPYVDHWLRTQTLVAQLPWGLDSQMENGVEGEDEDLQALNLDDNEARVA
jgi:hypothetical protein